VRFEGPGWPITPGTEVRLRSDLPGVYVFDGGGGHALPPGALAAYFEGGEVTRRGIPLRFFFDRFRGRREPPPADPSAAIVCAVFAELAGEARSEHVRRCEAHAPRLWRLGMWRAERTAIVPIELPRRQLQMGPEHPPPLPPPRTARPWLEEEALARLSPDAPPEIDAVGPLRVRNQSATRVVVVLHGVPAGSVDPGAELLLSGLRPGMHEVGSFRPLGAVVQRGRPVAVPGLHRVCDGRCRRRRPPP
jgi:hypothetical protein